MIAEDPAVPSLLATNGLRKRFGGLAALDGVSFAIPVGGVHAIIGPNGAGKSTLFNLVSGVERPTSGSVTFEGRDITGRPAHEVTRAGIARTFQNVRLFRGMSALENVMVGRHTRTRADFLFSVMKPPWVLREERGIARRARELLDLVGLSHKADERARDLPLPEERRLEIARALAAEPRLLLLDEPAAGISGDDTTAVVALLSRIRELGVTILLIEHNMSLVMDVCDDVLVLNFGRAIAHGAPDRVRADPEVVAAYLGSAA